MKVPHDPNELIAIVDDNDTIIGISPRRNHADGKPHRETSVLLINPRNEILVQERADDGRLDYSASGHFPYDQNYLEGAMREVEEELGLRLEPSRFVKVSKHRLKSVTPYGVNDRFIALWEVRADYRIEEMALDPLEVKSVRYYSIPELRRIISQEPERMAAGFSESLQIYFKSRGF